MMTEDSPLDELVMTIHYKLRDYNLRVSVEITTDHPAILIVPYRLTDRPRIVQLVAEHKWQARVATYQKTKLEGYTTLPKRSYTANRTWLEWLRALF